MSEKINKVFHPGYYLKEYLEEVQLTQDEFAKRLGISGKQISLILAENATITPDIAYKISKLIGTSIELWLNLQSSYDAWKIELEAKENFEEEKKIYKMIDKKFLINLKIIKKEDSTEEAISKLRLASMVSSLTLHCNKDIYSFYRTAINTKEETIENIVCKNVWVSLASSSAKKQITKPFNEEKIKQNIDILRSMTLQDSNIFYPKMKELLNECGVALVILPSLKNSNINGVVKWIDNEKVMMALNTRGAYNDKFWFSFFHELKHILQKHKRKMIINQENEFDDSELELEADIFAMETLIPSKYINELKYINEDSIINLANKLSIHPGIVVGRLQKEKRIPYSKYNYLKIKYDINGQ